MRYINLAIIIILLSVATAYRRIISEYAQESVCVERILLQIRGSLNIPLIHLSVKATKNELQYAIQRIHN